MKSLFFTTFFLFSSLSFCFIPKAHTIISKVVENNGTGVYGIEQEVQFPGAQEPFVLKETWFIENENRLKVVVAGTKELKDKLRWVFVYQNGEKSILNQSGKETTPVSELFIERYFHFRKPENLSEAMVKSNAVPHELFRNETYKPGSEPDFKASPYLQLARIGGTIAYAFRSIAENHNDTSAFFVEQDQFVLRKFRIRDVEVSADKYNIFARGLNFPRLRTVKWGPHQVNIQTLQVSARNEKALALHLDKSTAFDFPEMGAAKPMIEEFYKRFR